MSLIVAPSATSSASSVSSASSASFLRRALMRSAVVRHNISYTDLLRCVLKSLAALNPSLFRPLVLTCEQYCEEKIANCWNPRGCHWSEFALVNNTMDNGSSLFRFLLPLPTNFHLDKNRYICNTTHYQILGPLASNEATEATDATEGLPPVPPTADKVETYAEESQVFDIVFFVVLAANWALFTHACILVTCRSTLQILWPGASCDRCDFFHDMFGSWLIFLIRLHFLNHGRLSFSAFSLLTDFFRQSRHLFFPYVRPPLWHP